MLREQWSSDIWPKLKQSAEQILVELTQDSKLSPESPDLTRLAEAVHRLLNEGATFEFATPADTSWWRSVAGKQSISTQMSNMSARALGDSVIGQSAKKYEELSTAAKAQTDALVVDTERAGDGLNTAFEEQKKRADQLAQPLSYIGLDLPMVAQTFPTILGVALGLALVWLGWRRSELVQAWAALCEIEPAWRDPALALGFTRVHSKDSVLTVALACIWVAGAAWQLAVSDVVSKTHATKAGCNRYSLPRGGPCLALA